MKLRRDAATLKYKALSSLRRAVRTFNDLDDDGRASTVFLHLQHAFEMLLKAALVQRGRRVFDKRDGRAIGYERCVNLAQQDLGLTEDEAGTLRAIDALRDDEQHWLTQCSEGLMYAHTRAGVTIFDDLLQRHFGDRLANHWPQRVLPISSEPPRDIQTLIDDEYRQIRRLLAPGRRRHSDAQARIRSLLAMEAHVKEGIIISQRDVDRVERAVKKDADRSQVFPRLAEVQTEVAGEGIHVTVRFTKARGVPVRLVGADEDVEAGAVREIDLLRKFHWTKTDLAAKLGLTTPKSLALRRRLRIEDDENCRHDFAFGRTVHRQYSDNAFRLMKEALDGGLDINAVWREYTAGSGASSVEADAPAAS